MEDAKNEGLKRINNIPLPIHCLIQSSEGIAQTWHAPHYHEYIELLYVLEGSYEVKVNNCVVDLPCHSMYIIEPGEPHTTRRTGGKQAKICIKFLPQILYSSEQSVTELEYSIPYVSEQFGSRRKFEAEVLKDTFIPEAFDDIRKEQEQKKFGYELAVRTRVMQIFLWIIRFWHQEAGSPPIAEPNRAVMTMLNQAKQYVNENYATATLALAAKECGLSYGYFSRLFNTYMKRSFSDYVNLVRVNQSMKLLSSTDTSITEIALQMGFSTTSYYIQVFKKYKGISPNRFRQMFRNGTES